MSIETFKIVVTESKMITPNVRHIAFTRKDLTPFEFIPGQFITIHFETGGKSIKRSYSLATIPGKSTFIEIAASYFPGGPGTEFLYHLQPGSEVECSGPFGKLTLRDEHPARYVLIATGTGVTPYRSMLPQLEYLMQEKNLQVVVLLGVQSREELLYGEDFFEVASRHARFDFRAHYSRKQPADKRPEEYAGYVQKAFPSLELNPDQDVVYLCGNPSMIDEAFAELKAMGFDTAKVRREKYVSSPVR